VNGFEDPTSASELSTDAGCAVGRISTFLSGTVTISGCSIWPTQFQHRKETRDNKGMRLLFNFLVYF